MSIIKIDEAALYKAGFDRAFVTAMRHIVRQAGAEVGATTLPQLAGITDTLTPIVDGLVITITATNATLAEREVEQSNLPLSDHALTRRIDDMEAAAEQFSAATAIQRQISELRDEMAMLSEPAILPNKGGPIVSVTPGASPFTYAAPSAGALLMDGGPVTLIEYGRAGIFTSIGLVSGSFPMSDGDQLRVTYGGAPSMTFIPE